MHSRHTSTSACASGRRRHLESSWQAFHRQLPCQIISTPPHGRSRSVISSSNMQQYSRTELTIAFFSPPTLAVCRVVTGLYLMLTLRTLNIALVSARGVRVVSLLTRPHTNAGNSLNTTFYEKDIVKICRGLEHWTSTLFYRKFNNCGQILPIGVQRDGISCGICVLNALEHVLFGAPLFTQKRRNFLRVQYFTDIAKSLLDHVSTSYGRFRLKELTFITGVGIQVP